jgi:hypothetical protein
MRARLTDYHGDIQGHYFIEQQSFLTSFSYSAARMGGW